MTSTDPFAHRAAGWDIDPRKIKMAESYVNELLKHVTIRRSWKAMEIGAGTGLVGIQLLPKVKAMIFEDTSEAMLLRLRQKLTNEELLKTEILHGEVTEYSRADIDLVVSNMAFHHIEDIEGLLAHLSIITRTGAMIVVGDIRTEDGSFHRFEPIPHKGFDTDELSAIFEKAGFRVKTTHTYRILSKEISPGKTAEFEQFLLVAEKTDKKRVLML